MITVIGEHPVTTDELSNQVLQIRTSCSSVNVTLGVALES